MAAAHKLAVCCNVTREKRHPANVYRSGWRRQAGGGAVAFWSMRTETWRQSMPFKYWRTVVCATALGVCGLAVWADDSLRGAKKAVFTPAKDPPKLVVEVSPSIDPLVLPQAIDLQIEKASSAKIEPITPAPPSLPEDPPPLPAGKFNLPPPMLDDLTQPKPEIPKDVDSPRRPASTDVPPPVEKPVATKPPVAPTLVLPSRPSQPATISPSAQPVVVPFKTCLHAGGTDQPHFEIKDGDVLLLKVSCECLELHSQQGVMAKGQVRLHGSGLDGTCEQLTISWPRKVVQLNGNVNLNCQREGNLLQIAAEQMTLRLSGTGQPTIKASGVSTIAPAADKSAR
jgi:hypothetical protein